AEDGIRDFHVTGVQTCALPISITISVDVVGDTATEPDETFTVELSNAAGAELADATGLGTILDDDVATVAISAIQGGGQVSPYRSEERRVGKGGRSGRPRDRGQ